MAKSIDSLSIPLKVIRSIVNIHPNGITLDQLNKEYQQSEGESIPFGKFGYYSLQQFLFEEMESIVRFEKVGLLDVVYPIATENSRHIINMVQRQNSSNKRQNELGVQFPRNVYSNHAVLQQQLYNQHFMQQALLHEQQLRLQNQIAARQRQYFPNVPFPAAKQVNYPKIAIDFNRPVGQMSNTVAKSAEAKSPNGMKASPSELNLEFPQAPAPMPMAKTENVKIMSKIRLPPLLLAKINNNEPIYRNDIAKSKQAVQCNEEKIDDRIHSVQDDKEKIDDIINPADSPSNEDDQSFSSSYNVSSIDSADDESLSVEKEKKPIRLSNGMVIDASVCEVNCPFTFWIQLDEYTNDLKEFVLKMSNFYEIHKDDEELQLLGRDIRDKRVIATSFMGRWYRAEVQNTSINETVVVSLIDYGTLVDSNTSDIRRLVQEFHDEPVYAVCCKLGNIQPIGNKWTNASSQRFVDLIKDEPLHVRILKVNPEQRKTTVQLILKSTKRCINEEMISLGLAKPIQARTLISYFEC